MSLGRKLLIAGIIALFILAKVYFLVSAVHLTIALAIPAFLLILSEPSDAQ